MGELWVNYAELADAIGEDGAEKLCRAVGGVSTYIPRTQPEGSPLCGVIGMERMRRLCSAFGGLRVTLPPRYGSRACWNPARRRGPSPSKSASRNGMCA